MNSPVSCGMLGRVSILSADMSAQSNEGHADRQQACTKKTQKKYLEPHGPGNQIGDDFLFRS